ncbi:DUF4192 domain-containing protein [Aeromicrobium sp. Sec7.5]|uniref:DUF4192 domain-containing protein n=1 Tax=Aeromicrobium sp. Sec7.5 TaxID=3121276 RepID=UPI002FE4A041
MSRRRRTRPTTRPTAGPDQPESVFTAHDVGDVLAAVPTLFGFRPAESFIAIATYGPRCRFGFSLRLDLPDLDLAGTVADVAVHHLRRQGADGAILLALSEDHERAEAVVRAGLQRLEPDITPVVIAWADGRRYWQPLPGFPRQGIGYEAPAHHEAVVRAVAAGQEILAGRDDLVARFARCSGAVLDRMADVTEGELDRVLQLFGGSLTDSALVGVAVGELDVVLDRALNEQERLSDVEVALVSVWGASVLVRDELMSRINRDTARDWLRVLTDVSGRVVPPFEPSVLCLAGFAAYMTGDGAQAVIALERSLAADPEHVLSQLLMQLIQGGVSPEQYEAMGEMTIVEAQRAEALARQRERSA